MKQHANAATRNALNNRAISAANWLDTQFKYLLEQAKEQDVPLFDRERQKPFTMSAYDLTVLLESMRHHSEELRKFVWFDKKGR